MMTIGAGNGKDEYKAQAEFIERAKRFAQDFCVSVDIPAHIRKPGENLKPPTKADIKGAGEISNLADNVFAFWRVPKDLKMTKEFSDASTMLVALKGREIGEEASFKLAFDVPSKRFVSSIGKYSALNRQYGWFTALESARNARFRQTEREDETFSA